MTEITPIALIQLFQEQAILEGSETLEPNTDLFAAGMDSIAMMQLVLHMEDHFGVAVQPVEITRERFSTPQSLATFLQYKRAA
jgi:acyl carrier protein